MAKVKGVSASRNQLKTQSIFAGGKQAYWLVFLFAVALFSNSILGNYNLDDELVTRNHALTSKGFAAIPEIFVSPYYQDNMGYAYEYRPVVHISFAIEHQFFGENAHVSHFFNVMLYAIACTVLLSLLIELMPLTNRLWLVGITLLFVAHTSHTEVVSSIKNRDEILALLFGLLAFKFMLKAFDAKAIKLYVAAAVFYAVALLSKASAVSFVFIIPVAVLLFRQVRFLPFSTICAILIVPSFFLLNLTDGYTRVKFVSVALAGLFIIYTVFHYKQIFSGVNLQSVFSGLLNSFRTQVSTESDFSPLSWLLPEKGVLDIKAILCCGIAATFYLVSVKWGYYMLSVIPLLILAYSAWFKQGALSFWADVALGTCLVGTSFLFERATMKQEYFIAATSLFIISRMVFYGKGKLVLWFILLVALGFSNPVPDTFVSIFSSLIFVSIARRFAIANYAFAALFLLVLVSPLFFGQQPGINDIVWYTGLIGVFIAVKWNKKLPAVLSFLFSAGCVTWFFIINPFAQKSAVKDSFEVVQDVSAQINPQIIKKQDRPLHYTEQVVMPSNAFTERVGTSLEVLFHYLHKTIVPYPLAFYYGYRFITPMKVNEALPILSLILYTALGGIAFWAARANPLIGFGLFIYLFGVAVFSDYFQYVPGMVADRYMLVPSLGWCMVLVALLLKLAGLQLSSKVGFNEIKPIAKYGFLTVFLLYSVLTFSRNLDWKDDLTLFRKDILYVDESAQAHNLLALHLMQHSAVETDQNKQMQFTVEALSHFQRAQQIYPPFFNVAYDIGRVYTILGKPDSAIISFERAITLDTLFPDVYLKLADLYFQNQDFEKSNFHLRKFISMQPTDYTGYNKLSYNFYLQKRYEESLQVNRDAIKRVPGVIDPYLNIAHTFVEMKLNDSAYYYMKMADKLMPNNPQVQSNIQQLKNAMQTR